MPGFEDMLRQIGQVIGTIGGNAISALNSAAAIEHGGLNQVLAQQSALWDDPAFRQQAGQPGFMSAFKGGLAGGGFPQIGPDPNVISAGYGNQGQLIGPTARTNLPPLSPYAQAQQAKDLRDARIGSMTPEMATQLAGQAMKVPGGPSRMVIPTEYGNLTYGGAGAGALPQGDQPPDVVHHDGYDYQNTPHGWKVLGKTKEEKTAAEEPDLGVPVDSSGQPIAQPAAPAAPARGQADTAPPAADPVTVTGPITSQDYQAYQQHLQRAVALGQLSPEQANAQLFGLHEAVTRPAEQTIASAQGETPASPTPAPQAAPAPPSGAPPTLNLPPGARKLPDGTFIVPSGVSAKGKETYATYKPEKPQKITYPSAVLSAFASGTDPMRGGAPATADQVAAGKAWQANQIEQKKAGAAAVASQHPLGQQTIQNLATAASIHSLATSIRPLLDKADAKRWIGPVAGRAAWELYSTVGYVPNETIGKLITLGEIFKSESAGRLARLAGSRSRTVWQELTVHPPHPWDEPSLLRSKLDQIEQITNEAGKLEAKLAKMPREQAAKFMDKQMRDTPTAGGAPQGAPQAQGAPVPGVPGAIDLGPAQ